MSRYPDDLPSRRRSHADEGYHSRSGHSGSGRTSHRRRDGYDASDEDDVIPRRRESGAHRRTRSKPPPETRQRAPAEIPRRSKSTRESDRYDRSDARPRRPDALRSSRDDHRPRRSHHADHSEPEYERPSRHRPERSSRQNDGYGTDRPPRRTRDDDHHDRGYRTDGREPRRERRRAEDRPARSSRDQGRPRGGPGLPKMDMNNMLEKGQKGWKSVEPVAKPLLAQLAKQYLEKGR